MLALQSDVPTIRRLQDPSTDEIQKIIDVLEDAFGRVGGDWSLLRSQFEFLVREAALGGWIDVALENEDIVGVAVWFGPGQLAGLTADQRDMAFKIFFSKCPQELQKWWAEHMQRLGDEALGPGFKKDHWHLLLLGVLRDHHRRGIAKALMNAGEARAKVDGLSLVLETVTQIDVLIYKKMGFAVKGQIAIEYSGIGQTTIYQMLKPLTTSSTLP
ncbi:hypothetical protein H0H93_013762 [Arthromyces matolae]|nr:hypothetical protein H0H93_013762 [Arthromyces matolae]